MLRWFSRNLCTLPGYPPFLDLARYCLWMITNKNTVTVKLFHACCSSKPKDCFKVFKLIIFRILIVIICDLPSNDIIIIIIINAWVTIIFIPDLRMYSPLPPLPPPGLDLSEFLISVSHSWIHTKHNSSTRHHNSKASGPRLQAGELSWLHLSRPLSTHTKQRHSKPFRKTVSWRGLCRKN